MKYFVLLATFAFLGCAVVAQNTSVVTDSQSAGLSFKVRPTDAKIYIDKEFVGLAKYFDGEKRRLNILPGEHIIELKRKGYKDIVKHVYVSDTQEHFSYDMARDSGQSRGGDFVIKT